MVNFIYNQASCEEMLQNAGFDIEEVKDYLCFDEIDKLKADAYAASEDRDYYEALADDYARALNEATNFLYDIKDALYAGRKTKNALADEINRFLTEL